MYQKPILVAFDLEGVFVPEIWIAVAEKTGIEKLRLTTRDVADYDELMRGRLQLLREHNLKLADIQAVISTLSPLNGAADFLSSLRQKFPVVILSDTFYQFAGPLMAKLGLPLLFCNSLEVDESGMITDYHLRIRNGKQEAVRRFRELNFRVIAAGDSYNDTTMLGEADLGILFRPSENVKTEFPQFPAVEEYGEMYTLIRQYIQST